MTKNPLPDQALENHIAILGKTGSGKTYTAKGFVERLLDKKKRVCIIDPTGVWYGLKSSSDGKNAAYPMMIFGGDHADFEIKRDQGVAIATIIAESDTPAIIDTSLMTVGDRTKFFTDFAETLLRKNRQPLNLILDEAHNFAPQGKVPDPQAGKMLHASNNLLSMGRARGLRVMMITQRPQKLHKDSLTQAASLIAMQLVHNLDRKSVEDWIGENADPQQGKDLIKSLASLKKGTGWVWSPDFDVLTMANFPKIKTYDSSSAPTGSSKKIVFAKLTPAFVEKMLEDVAVSLPDDVPALKGRIAQLERELKQIKAAPPVVDQKLIKKIATDSFNDGRKSAIDSMGVYLQKIDKPSSPVQLNFSPPLRSEQTTKAIKDMAAHAAKVMTPDYISTPPETVAAPSRKIETLSSAQRKILTVLAQYPNGRSNRQIALLSGYSSKGGGFRNSLSALRTSGFIVGTGDAILITQDGANALGGYTPLPVGQALRDYWVNECSKSEGAILTVLFNAYPNSLTKEQIAEQAGYEPGGGGFRNSLSRLRTLDLIEGFGDIKASADLF